MTNRLSKLTALTSLIAFNLFGQVETQQFIEVIGLSEKEITPDNIELTVILSAAENVKKESELLEKEKQIVACIKQFNIPENDIAVDKIGGYRYGYFKTSSNKYALSKIYKINVKKPDDLDNLIIKLFEAGANDVRITKLTNNRLEQFRVEAIQEAIANAKSRAMEIGKSLNITIGNAIQVRELEPKSINVDLSSDRFYMAQGISLQKTSDEYLNMKKILLKYSVSIRFEIK